MVNSGYVRRIDDLGRVVVPRDIRKQLGYTEGDSFEIYYDKVNKTVMLKPYEPYKEEREI